MSNKTQKLLILNLPYFIAGLVCTNPVSYTHLTLPTKLEV